MDPIIPLDLRKLKVLPLSERDSLSQLNDVLIDPSQDPPRCSDSLLARIKSCAERIQQAKQNGSATILMYGAHLIKNGGQKIVQSLLQNKFLTHLATNGAGIIHDWEFAFLGRTEESVKKNVAQGKFGTWDETGRNIHLALMAGGLKSEGFGKSLGRLIEEQAVDLPAIAELERMIREAPNHPITSARADSLQTLRHMTDTPYPQKISHPNKSFSLLAECFRLGVPFTVHPGIGYDIFTNHPLFSGSVVGRAAEIDFRLLGSSVEKLDHGVVLSVGSAIMAPQVFEKSLSCVNNLRLADHRNIIQDHAIFVVDLQDGGGWDWSAGEPPKTNPAYYLRFCKSFSRMGGQMHYLQCDNVIFLHHLLHLLLKRAH